MAFPLYLSKVSAHNGSDIFFKNAPLLERVALTFSHGFGGRGKEIGHPCLFIICLFVYCSLCLEHWWENLFLNLKARLQPHFQTHYLTMSPQSALSVSSPCCCAPLTLFASISLRFALGLAVCMSIFSSHQTERPQVEGWFYSLGSQFHWPLHLEHCDSVFFCICLCTAPGRY